MPSLHILNLMAVTDIPVEIYCANISNRSIHQYFFDLGTMRWITIVECYIYSIRVLSLCLQNGLTSLLVDSQRFFTHHVHTMLQTGNHTVVVLPVPSCHDQSVRTCHIQH